MTDQLKNWELLWEGIKGFGLKDDESLEEAVENIGLSHLLPVSFRITSQTDKKSS